MLADEASSRSEILHSNRELRRWSQDLRERGRRARAAAREMRTGRAKTGCRSAAGSPSPEVGRHASPQEVVLPSLGEVCTDELVAILVDRHHFAVWNARRAVAAGMATCGYPVGYERVVAADAFEVMEWALQHRWSS